MSYWGFVGSVAGATARASADAAQSVGYRLATLVGSQGIRPSRRSIKRGILVPGDGPPVGAAGTFLDYREVLVPRNVAPLQQGTFPLGRIQDPGRDEPGFPVFLDWGFVARHVAVIGPAGSGKTFNLLAPWVVAAIHEGLSAVAVDVKGDFLLELSDARKRLGLSDPFQYYRWDVSEPASSRSWNPLSEVASPDDAAQVALAFLGEVEPNDHQKFFAERDHRWLRGLVWLVAQALGSQTHPSVLYQLIVSQKWLTNLVQSAPHAAHEVVDLVQHSQSDYAKVTAGLANRLSWLADPYLADMLDGSHPRAFTFAQALSRNALLLVGARESGGERSAIAASLFLNLLRIKCLGRFGSNPVPIFWVLDEARRYAHRIQLDQMLDLLRGANSPVCVGLQDVNQLGTAEKQHRMLANCDSLLVLKGASSATAQFFSSRLGKVTAPVTSQSMDHTGTWRPSISHQERPLLGDREIMYPPVGDFGGVAQLRAGSPYPFLFTFQ